MNFINELKKNNDLKYSVSIRLQLNKCLCSRLTFSTAAGRRRAAQCWTATAECCLWRSTTEGRRAMPSSCSPPKRKDRGLWPSTGTSSVRATSNSSAPQQPKFSKWVSIHPLLITSQQIWFFFCFLIFLIFLIFQFLRLKIVKICPHFGF